MRGGAIPPGTKWLQSLPEYSDQTGYGIYTGTVNGVKNLVVRIFPNVLGMVQASPTDRIYFNEVKGEFSTVPVGTFVWTQAVIEGSGIDKGVASVTTFPDITRQDITFRLLPADPPTP